MLSFSFSSSSSTSSSQAKENLFGYSSIRVRGANTKFTINIKSTNYNFNGCCDHKNPAADLAAAAGRKWNKHGGNGTATAAELAAGGTTTTMMRCPMERVMKVGAGCVDGLVTMVHDSNGPLGVGRAGVIGGPVAVDSVVVKQCCSVLGGDGMVGLNTTADCLCATLKVKALDLKAYAPLARHLLASCANMTTNTAPTPQFTCSPVS
ncbi:unnamed protein product [Linum tenue]|uniref:Bifunctional inhibitor/plant lipid transfer protein/seed storage helical domain-containing protein n=1 Tax=Linum tenue TaxID=586396 RepID=A0AAV0SA12_9ROSI|nr:unnamed protein product [Linum tenue]